MKKWKHFLTTQLAIINALGISFIVSIKKRTEIQSYSSSSSTFLPEKPNNKESRVMMTDDKNRRVVAGAA